MTLVINKIHKDAVNIIDNNQIIDLFYRLKTDGVCK